MSQHRSLKGASTIAAKRNVLKRFERVELLKKRGQWKENQKVFDLLPKKFSRLFNIGRLDAQTEGLILLTNDGDLAQRLTHPRYKIEKEYEVTLDRRWDATFAPKLLGGIFFDGQRAKIARLHSITSNRLRVVLRQGINRQIRRMFHEIGYEVKRLVRVRIGALRLGDLPGGHWRPLTKSELEALRRSR